jgi:hypothetical protein
MKKRFASRARRALVGVFAVLALGVYANPASASTSTEIANLPVVDALKRTEGTLSNGGQWSPLKWDTESSTHKTGKDTTEGWAPSDAYPSINGAYWNPTSFSGMGTAASMTMMVNPGSEGSRYLSLWLNMSSPGSTQSGYQLKWVERVEPAGSYTVTLSRWSGGTQTVLNSNNWVSIPKGSTLAISQKGSTVTGWINGGAGLEPLLLGYDRAYTSGYAGIEGSGNGSRSTNFKAGAIGSLAAEIADVSTLDTFHRTENPLSNEGKWTALNWATASPKTGTTNIETGWIGAAGTANSDGAYWNPAQFTDVASSDSAGGVVARVTMAQVPTNVERWGALWIDMPNPSSAKSGYQLKWFQEAESKLKVEIIKWVAGGATILASKPSMSIPAGTTLALSDQNGTVRAWTGTGATLSVLLSAADNTYSGGYAGIEASGSYTRLTDFGAGTLVAAPKLDSLTLLDSFNRANENPLSNGGKWLKTSWAGNPGQVHEFYNWPVTQSWGSLDTEELSGAYWQGTSFAEGANGNAVAILSGIPGVYTQNSLWLDMPNPGQQRSGYEINWKDNPETPVGPDFVLTLSKWVSGKQTVLATKSGISPFRVALAKKGGILSVWVADVFNNDDFERRPILTVADSSYSSGYTGLQETGYGEGGLANFSGGALGS